ncbi:MAG: nucleoside hydrolase-like domain-containing protein, partial [Bacteroidota bacterium]
MACCFHLAIAGCLEPSGRPLDANDKHIIWVYSDLSDPRDQRAGGHPQNDPDDICSMASLLLTADQFDIRGIVVASTTRENLQDPMPFIKEVFVAAYEHDWPFLTANGARYQAKLPFMSSSLTQGGRSLQFDPEKNYADLGDLVTVNQLVQLAEKEPVYVLSWGPLTESAMAVKHCLDAGKEEALKNLFFISHWTKSSVAQGSPSAPFEVANCKDDRAACDYLHQVAARDKRVRFIELGCVGQKGLVSGITVGVSNQMEALLSHNTRLGQIFTRSKWYFNKPDFSDASTHWLLFSHFRSKASDSWSLSLDDYPHDGSLAQAEEEELVEKFKTHAWRISSELWTKGLSFSSAQRPQSIPYEPFSEEFIASYFTYVYYNSFRQAYGLHLPYRTSYQLIDGSGDVIMTDTLDWGNHQLDLDSLDP